MWRLLVCSVTFNWSLTSPGTGGNPSNNSVNVAFKRGALTPGAPQIRASRSRGVRECLRRNGPEHLANHIWEARVVVRTPQAKRARAPQVSAYRSLGSEDASSGAGLSTSRTTSWNPEVVRISQAKRARAPQVRASRSSPRFRGSLRRNVPGYLANHILEPRVVRRSQEKRA